MASPLHQGMASRRIAMLIVREADQLAGARPIADAERPFDPAPGLDGQVIGCGGLGVDGLLGETAVVEHEDRVRRLLSWEVESTIDARFDQAMIECCPAAGHS